MEYYEKFSKYSNVELLKILKTEDEYQQIAIEVTKKILSEREVSSEEYQEVENYFKQKNEAKEKNELKINTLKEHIIDVTEPFFIPTEKLEITKWVKILLLSILIQYAYSIYSTLFYLLNAIKYSTSLLNIVSLLHITQLVYISSLFYLIYKKKHKGWILLFCFSFIYFIFSIPNAYSYLRMIYLGGFEQNPGRVIFSVFMNCATLFFLWRKEITNYFGVTEIARTKTLKVAVFITFAIFLIMILIIKS